MPAEVPTQAPRTAAELEEEAAAEEARVASGDWDSLPQGKPENFGGSFRRLIGLLAPHKVALIIVSVLGALGVLLTIIAPKVLGEATNIIFEGFISSQLPSGVTGPRWKTCFNKAPRSTPGCLAMAAL